MRDENIIQSTRREHVWKDCLSVYSRQCDDIDMYDSNTVYSGYAFQRRDDEPMKATKVASSIKVPDPALILTYAFKACRYE